VAGLAAKAATTAEAALWPSLYLPPLVGVLAAVWIMRVPALRRPRLARPARGAA
jgi:hypothetical protein